MRLIDLHLHTTASDGSSAPSQVCQMALDKNLAAIAITDHDTVDGVKEAINYGSGHDIEVIPGIELSCVYNDTEIHVLGYYVDYDNPDLLNILNEIKQKRLERNIRMCQLFQKDGIDMTIEKLQAGNPDSVITRAHFARVLLEEGIVKTKDQAFKKYIGKNNKYYLPKHNLSVEEGMEILKKYSKGAFLAHPLLYKLGYKQLDEMLDYMKSLGLKGVEVYHSSNNSYESGRLKVMAESKSLLISGGTDYHGVIKPDIQIGYGRGSMRITEEILSRIKRELL